MTPHPPNPPENPPHPFIPGSPGWLAYERGRAAADSWWRERLTSDETVEAVAEAMYDEAERRDPCGELDDHVHPGEQPRRLPLQWQAVIAQGLWPGDVAQYRRDARIVVERLASLLPVNEPNPKGNDDAS